ncbi:unnamed protein product [Prunus brigantina]
MRLNLDLLEGEREKVIVRVAFYQQRLKSYYDKRAKIRQFQLGDLWGRIVIQLFISSVLRETQGNGQKRPKRSPKNAEYTRSPSRGTLAFANILREILRLLLKASIRSLICSLSSVYLIRQALSSSTCLIHDVCHHLISCIILCSIFFSYRLFSHLLFSNFHFHSISLLTLHREQVRIEHLDVFISNAI